MNDKMIGGVRACDCDHRYKPRLGQTGMDNPFYYYVYCPNCGAKAKPFLHNAHDSHVICKINALEFWNRRDMQEAS